MHSTLIKCAYTCVNYILFVFNVKFKFKTTNHINIQQYVGTIVPQFMFLYRCGFEGFSRINGSVWVILALYIVMRIPILNILYTIK